MFFRRYWQAVALGGAIALAFLVTAIVYYGWVGHRLIVVPNPSFRMKVGHKVENGILILEGSVRKSGKRLRLTAQLINASDNAQLWAERYDRELEDVFEIQDEIASSIVAALRVVLSDDEKRAIEQVPTANVEAYGFYLRGRQYFHQHRRKAHEYARQMFERAIELDPGYALAHAGVADCCSFLYQYFDASPSNLKRADAASRRALELAPSLAEAHASRGLAVSLSGRFEEADTEFEMAMKLDQAFRLA